MNKKIIILVLIGLFFLDGVFALGITPGRTSLEYQEDFSIEIPFSVLNTGNDKMEVILTADGELSDSVTLFENKLDFLPSEESKGTRYRFTMPDNLEPGLHTAEVVALQVPKAGQDGTFVGGTVAVVSQIHIHVPYPGKFADYSFQVLDADQGATATFVIPVINRGQVGISDLRAQIEITTLGNEPVTTIETDFTSLDAGVRTELSGKWDVDALPGEYIAKISVFYDGETRTSQERFSVGVSDISIESILVNEFVLGEIAKLQILVENKFNKDVENVYAQIEVYNEDDRPLAEIKTANENIPALSQEELTAFWDTEGVEPGEYVGKLSVVFNEQSTDQSLLLRVTSNSLTFQGVGYAIRESGGGFQIVDLLLVLVIVMLVVNAAWFIFFKRFMGKKRRR